MLLGRVHVICVIAGTLGAGCAMRETRPAGETQPAVSSTRPGARIRLAATQPAASMPTTSMPAAEVVSGPPWRLDVASIVRLVFERNAHVASSREEMVAASHALEEFRANVSRFEPFTEVRTDASDFPHRRSTRTIAGEAVAGLQKETFEGAILRVEGGGSASRARVGEPAEGEDPVDEGAGGLFRGRIEVPFVGSRRRQERLISQAFQESQARKARLEYLEAFHRHVLVALDYYNQSLLYRNTADSYAAHVSDLEKFASDPRVSGPDQSRVLTVVADYQSREAQYRSYNQVYLRYLKAALALDQGEAVELINPEYHPEVFLERSSTPEGIAAMIEEARQNNPTFKVLEDAIRDAELQRRLAIEGQFDITAFVEGTIFPLGAETYDDRFDGWMLGGGVNVRLNDRRVLEASRKKAEANIRAFRAKSESEMIEIRRQIVTETEALRSEGDRRRQLLEVIQQKREEYESRARTYLETKRLLVDQVLSSRTEQTNAELNLHSLQYSHLARIIRLQGALGIFYRTAGLSVE